MNQDDVRILICGDSFCVPDAEIDALNLESLRHRSIHGIIDDRQRMFDTLAGIQFEEQDLPSLSELLTEEEFRKKQLVKRLK